jgi:ferritin
MEMDLGKKYSEAAVKLATEDFLTVTKLQEFIAFQIESIGFYGDLCSVKKDLSDDKFQQLFFEKSLKK